MGSSRPRTLGQGASSVKLAVPDISASEISVRERLLLLHAELA